MSPPRPRAARASRTARPASGSPATASRAPAPRARARSAAYRTVAEVQDAVIACERCARLRTYCAGIARAKKRAFRDQVYWGKPVPAFGDPAARLLVIGLAPAAHGGNRTGRVFTGDSSGSWLYEALHRTGFSNQPDSTGMGDGLVLTDCYVTAAAHCAPPANKPTPDEFDRCQPYLEAELGLLDRLRVTLTLGHLAHDRWLKATRFADVARPKFAHGAEVALGAGATLLCSYHPSRQNTNTGRLTRAMWHAVFQRARALVDRA